MVKKLCVHFGWVFPYEHFAEAWRAIVRNLLLPVQEVNWLILEVVIDSADQKLSNTKSDDLRDFMLRVQVFRFKEGF
jgi:hypothetical protein